VLLGPAFLHCFVNEFLRDAPSRGEGFVVRTPACIWDPRWGEQRDLIRTMGAQSADVRGRKASQLWIGGGAASSWDRSNPTTKRA